MIPAAFDYVRAGSADEAIALLAEHGDEAKLLAGGHSLLPLMKLRLAHAVGADRHRPPAATCRTSATPATTSPSARSPATATSRPSDLLQAAGAAPRPRRRPRRRPAGAPPRHDRRLASPTPTRRRTCPPSLLALGAHARGHGPERRRARSPPPTSSPGFLESALAPDELLTEIRVPKIGRRRLVVPEVQPPGPGLGHRRRGRRAQQRRRPASAWSTWARRRSWPRAVEQALAGGASAADAAEQAADGRRAAGRPQRQRRVPQAPGQGPGPPGPRGGRRRRLTSRFRSICRISPFPPGPLRPAGTRHTHNPCADVFGASSALPNKRHRTPGDRGGADRNGGGVGAERPA